MNSFIQRHDKDVIGVLSGFDRLVFRGTLRSIAYGDGLDRFLGAARVRYKDFGTFAQGLTEKLKAHAEDLASREGRPFKYLPSSSQSKQDIAKDIAQRDGITEGLVCVLRCVEPCMTFSIRRDDRDRLRFLSQERKCLHLYFYYLDRDFGLMHVRLATWLPFGIQVCLNGREYLARRMAKTGIGFEQRDNCFVRIDDVPAAQEIMRQLEQRKWQRFLGILARRVNPLVRQLDLRPYYWSVRASEYATDVMFRDAEALQRVYPALVQHALQHFDCRDVLRFLGRKTNAKFSGEVSSSLLKRSEGVRIKHWVEENSLKMYDKQGRVLRIETTINNARRFKVRRMTTRKGVRAMHSIPMRLGIMDLVRRVDISRAANQRYLEALAVVNVPSPVANLLDQVSRPVKRQARPYRALRPISTEEADVFAAVLSGTYLLKGFTNRDLRQSLGLTGSRDPTASRRASGRITRLLRLLRAHKLIRKVSGTRYYRVTPHGHRIMTTALAVRAANVASLAA